jgi:GAF domain-containing protein
MIIAEIPKSEDIRLTDLQLYDILYSTEETEFDQLRELAAAICNCPISLITLIDRNTQWFKSKQGIADTETSRDLAFCSHAILKNEVMVVEDATKDIRFADNPFVTGEMNIRFYAGAPIVSPNGQNLGTICVLDQRPRVLTAAQERALVILSGQVTKLLELRLKSKIIEERAADLMNIKNQAVQHFVKEQDKEKLVFAKELHENIAQELVASRLYLEMAMINENDRLQNVQLAIDSVGSALTEVKNLSYSISPTTLESSDFRVMMDHLLEEQASSIPFELSTSIVGSTTSLGFAQTMNCIKITESWLQVLKQQPEVTNVHILLKVGDAITLSIQDDATGRSIKERERNVISSMLYYRVIGMNGTIQFSEPTPETNLLSVNFPLVMN